MSTKEERAQFKNRLKWSRDEWNREFDKHFDQSKIQLKPGEGAKFVHRITALFDKGVSAETACAVLAEEFPVKKKRPRKGAS